MFSISVPILYARRICSNSLFAKKLYDGVRETSTAGIPLIEICNKLLDLLLFQRLTHLSSIF